MRSFFVMLIALGFSLTLSAAPASGEEFHDGFEYTKVIPPQPTQVEQGKIEVVEVFWYGCPHCYRFEPHMKKWLKNKPANISFIRIPAQFRPLWALHAKAFYVAQLLKVEHKIHEPFFEAIHKHNQKLDSQKKIREFFKKHGVTEKQFDEAFDSYSVKNRLKQARVLVEKYRISGVPTLIINGKYRASTSNVDGNDAKFLKLLDYLIKKESMSGAN